MGKKKIKREMAFDVVTGYEMPKWVRRSGGISKKEAEALRLGMLVGSVLLGRCDSYEDGIVTVAFAHDLYLHYRDAGYDFEALLDKIAADTEESED